METGEDARVLVKFLGMNGEEIGSMYVKQNDDMEVVLYDPGAGIRALDAIEGLPVKERILWSFALGQEVPA